jgi:hypothetical protein
MKNATSYYTYAWLRSDGSPYYIGKGSGIRAFDRRRKYCPSRDRILILKRNLSEPEAFKHEKYMIAVFGRKDLGEGILYNKTDGGDGASGLRHTVKSKQRIGKAQQGPLNVNYKKPEAAKHITHKRGEESHNWGRKHTKESCENMRNAKLGPKNPNFEVTGADNPSSKPVTCVETGITYCSAQEAEKQTNVHRSNIGACCRGKRSKAGGFRWVFA